MPKFYYSAHDVDGTAQQGIITAKNLASAGTQLRSQGLFPVDLSQEPIPVPREKKRPRSTFSKQWSRPPFLTSVNQKKWMIFTRQLTTLINAGLPILRGIKLLERQEQNPCLKKMMNHIGSSIEGGSTFAEALAQHPHSFNRLYINMVKAGEAGGVLGIVLDRLAEYMEKTQKTKNKIVAAMTYPIVIMVVSTAIVFLIMKMIVPKFEQIFADMLNGQALPPLTQTIMRFSHTVETHFFTIMISVVALIIICSTLRFSRWGRMVRDFYKLKLSPLKRLTRLNILARLARTLSTLLESGVPILQAVMIMKQTLNNELIASAVQTIHDQIKEGETMAAPIEASELFPPIFAGMVEVGEETGTLPKMLAKIADMYENEVDNTIVALSSIIEPLLIVFLALVIGTIVVALFLPMISIIGQQF